MQPVKLDYYKYAFSIRKYVNYELEFIRHNRVLLNKRENVKQLGGNASDFHSEGFVSRLCQDKRYAEGREKKKPL
jgi:hypothetical protein